MPSNDYWVDISGILGIQRAMLNAGSSVNDGNFLALDKSFLLVEDLIS